MRNNDRGGVRILGVDPGIERTGLGCIEVAGRGIRVLAAECVATQPSQPLPQRLADLYEAVTMVLEQSRPAVAVLEALFAHYRHPMTAMLMGHARGTICLALAQRRIPVIEHLPTRVKKAVVGRGHATKAQVQRMVATLLHLPRLPEPFDVADALALALCHAHTLQHGEPVVRPRRSARTLPKALQAVFATRGARR